ncbi:aldehyde dehydrogenase family protein [Streptomyces collinus]|uniref:aldehyde dehydrogenase family protein n=1 Tax=Streptomyces collinus TaxID=42684 RepID=UPI0033E3926F
MGEPGHPDLLDITSPLDESVIGRAVQAQLAEADRAVAAARASVEAGAWRTTPTAEWMAVLPRFTALREQDVEKAAHLAASRPAAAAPGAAVGLGAYAEYETVTV